MDFLNRYLSVRVGSNDFSNGSVYQVLQGVKHPYYRQRSDDYDYALVQLNETLTVSDTVNTISINCEKDDPTPGTECTLYGWSEGKLSNVDLPIKSRPDCQSHYKRFPPRMLCTENGESQGGCFTDRGGPLVCEDTVFGILSSYSCGLPSFVDFFSRTLPVCSWINQVSGIGQPIEEF